MHRRMFVCSGSAIASVSRLLDIAAQKHKKEQTTRITYRLHFYAHLQRLQSRYPPFAGWP
jgi:hypothetical protein